MCMEKRYVEMNLHTDMKLTDSFHRRGREDNWTFTATEFVGMLDRNYFALLSVIYGPVKQLKSHEGYKLF